MNKCNDNCFNCVFSDCILSLKEAVMSIKQRTERKNKERQYYLNKKKTSSVGKLDEVSKINNFN